MRKIRIEFNGICHMDKKFVINIGRQLGSGGHLIGEELSRQLGVLYTIRNLSSLLQRKAV